jgi:hypothetical protein
MKYGPSSWVWHFSKLLKTNRERHSTNARQHVT